MNIIKITSTVEVKAIENTQQALQHEVYGAYETIQLRDDSIMIVNENGATNDMPQNPIASLIARTQVYGPALIVGTDNGNLTDVPEQYNDLLMIEVEPG